MVHRSTHHDEALLNNQHQTAQPKSNWILQTTEDGSEVYYYNEVTKEMRYSLPSDAQFDTEHFVYDQQQTHHQHHSHNHHPTAAATISGNGAMDIITNANHNSGSPNIAHQRPIATTTDPDAVPLPPHWVRKVDTKGRAYFCNLLTDETTWSLDQIDPQTGYLVKYG
jgi:son of sevenless-like protein